MARLASLPGVGTASAVAARDEHAQVTGRVLPVLPALEDLLPWGGLRRGSTIAVRGSTSLLLALLAEATAVGSWAAVVGLPRLGVVAAGELGVEVSRLALVPRPGADFAAAAAALLDGVDLVVTGPPGRFGGTQTARRLSARARHRGAVLLAFGSWPGADMELRCTSARWSGLEGGSGYLREREVVVDAVGRGAAARPTRATLLLPGPDGTVTATGSAAVRPGLSPPEEVKVG
ncbi:hypothetical protein [Prauserella muralis]|uniref:Protein RecA n=1 Tax=Prauserella muralis TaxID=588067 RepID=A0A2V4BDZ7_9PSEU|nr:hypothetical protein [Prauserella muralis]PXY32279.1 hypothetical protein BAY60_08340 [Prauserella muralis]